MIPVLFQFLILAFLVICRLSGVHSDLRLTANPSDSVVIGGRVVLHCVVNLDVKRMLNTHWMHNNTMVGENCESFKKKTSHKADCPQGRGKNAAYYDYIIDPVSWDDRGVWSCYYGLNSSQLTLSVIAPQKISKFRVKKHGEVNGEGTKTLPYDLTEGDSLSLSCATHCGFPKSQVRWSFKNATIHGRLPGTSVNYNNTVCVGRESGMTVSSSKLDFVNCSTLKLVGLNEIMCSVDYTDPKIGESSKSIFFLCPGGRLAPALTYGEMIAIAIGAAIALILFFLNCMLLKENRRKAARNRALA